MFTVERDVPETVLNSTTTQCPPENLMIQRFDNEGRRQNICLDLSTNCSGQVCRYFNTTAKVEKYKCVSNALIKIPVIVSPVIIPRF